MSLINMQQASLREGRIVLLTLYFLNRRDTIE